MTAPLLSSADYARLRAIVEANLPHTAYVLVPMKVKRPGASWELVYPAATDPGVPSYDCALLKVGDPVEGVTWEQVQAGIVWRVVLPVAASVPATARLVVTGSDLDGTAWAKTLEVVSPHTPHSAQVRAKVLAREVLPAGSL